MLYCLLSLFCKAAGEQEKPDEEESKPVAKKKGRGSKRKAASQCNTVSALLCTVLFCIVVVTEIITL